MGSSEGEGLSQLYLKILMLIRKTLYLKLDILSKEMSSVILPHDHFCAHR